MQRKLALAEAGAVRVAPGSGLVTRVATVARHMRLALVAIGRDDSQVVMCIVSEGMAGRDESSLHFGVGQGGAVMLVGVVAPGRVRRMVELVRVSFVVFMSSRGQGIVTEIRVLGIF